MLHQFGRPLYYIAIFLIFSENVSNYMRERESLFIYLYFGMK